MKQKKMIYGRQIFFDIYIKNELLFFFNET